MKKTPSAKKVRFGIIGLGNMGSGHARNFVEGRIVGAELAAVADSFPANLARWPKIPQFTDAKAMMKSGLIDAVLVVTPHYSHTDLAIAAFEAGLHVVVEKPITVRKEDGEKIIAAARKHRKSVFGIMFNQRTDPMYRQVHKWLNDGTIGPVQRMCWTVTDWFRPEAYYASGSWRGTWGGEGGGILMNQCPHNLDLWQWFFGLPKRIRVSGGLGRFHNIEVEDDVTAIMEYASGATGVFIATTGEAPGMNRLEIVGDNGTLIVEGRTLRFLKNLIPIRKYNSTSTDFFGKPQYTEKKLEFPDKGLQHVGILRNFSDHLRKGTPLIAPGAEGLRGLELANAMTVALVEDRTVTLPMPPAVFSKMLASLVKKSASRPKKKAPKKVQRTVQTVTT